MDGLNTVINKPIEKIRQFKPSTRLKKEDMINLGKSKISYNAKKIFLYLLLINLSYVFIYPIIHMVITSIKDMQDYMDITVRWIPNKIFFENYKIALSMLDYKTGFFNSFIITVVCTIGHLISASFIGYGFARYKFPGRSFLFGIVVFSIIIPVQVIIVPLFYEFTQLFGLLDSRIPIILPTFFGYGLRGGLYIFLFRQYFINLPKELEEAAKIDGCGKIRTHFEIILPVAASVCMVTVVLSMVWHWNDHFEPRVYLFTAKKQTLMHALPKLFADLEKIKENLLAGDRSKITFSDDIADRFLKEVSIDSVLMAAVNVSILPILIVYGFLQKRFVQGIESAGIKG
ncbi:MAG TPA: carbohydrate ABC transporter permease [Clostridiaceae bacterium]|nr:carbohydrate ABC transporter permease [Clostridiaceae bacterium]